MRGREPPLVRPHALDLEGQAPEAADGCLDGSRGEHEQLLFVFETQIVEHGPEIPANN